MGELKWNKAFALEQAADDAELLDELVEIFKESFAADLESMEQGLGKNSVEQVGGAAHSIKGAAASLGIDGILEIAKEIEVESRAGGTSLAQAKLPELKILLQQLISM
jgi:HPt (histidine-containing phosphotransfer) domain-containing protein